MRYETLPSPSKAYSGRGVQLLWSLTCEEERLWLMCLGMCDHIDCCAHKPSCHIHQS